MHLKNMILPGYSIDCLLSSWHQPRGALEKGLLPKSRTQNQDIIFSKHKTACEITVYVLFNYTLIKTLYHCM